MSLQVLQLARRAAKTAATVLIGGESGTGKERLARYARSFAKGLKVLSYNEIPEELREEVIGTLG